MKKVGKFMNFLSPFQSGNDVAVVALIKNLASHKHTQKIDVECPNKRLLSLYKNSS